MIERSITLGEDWHRQPSGLYLPNPPSKPKRRPTAIDLFAGAGGFSIGFLQAGFEVVAALEWDLDAAATYLSNLAEPTCQIHGVSPGDEERLRNHFRKLNAYPGGNPSLLANRTLPPVRHFFVGDARKITGQKILQAVGMEPGEVSCVMGGPPCQGFSRLNTRRNCLDPRNSLVFEFARIVCEIQPMAFVMEEVPDIVNMVTPEGIPVMDALCHVFEQGGMGTYSALREMLLNTSGCGAALKGASGREAGKPAAVPDTSEAEDGQMVLFDEDAA